MTKIFSIFTKFHRVMGVLSPTCSPVMEASAMLMQTPKVSIKSILHFFSCFFFLRWSVLQKWLTCFPKMLHFTCLRGFYICLCKSIVLFLLLKYHSTIMKNMLTKLFSKFPCKIFIMLEILENMFVCLFVCLSVCLNQCNRLIWGVFITSYSLKVIKIYYLFLSIVTFELVCNN